MRPPTVRRHRTASAPGRTAPEPNPADARAVQERRAASSPSVW